MGATSRRRILHWHARGSLTFLAQRLRSVGAFGKRVFWISGESYLKLHRCATERVSAHLFALTLRSLPEEWKRSTENKFPNFFDDFNQVLYVIQSFLLIISSLTFGRQFNFLYFKFEFEQIRLIKCQFESFSDGRMCTTWSVGSLRGLRGSGNSQVLVRSHS